MANCMQKMVTTQAIYYISTYYKLKTLVKDASHVVIGMQFVHDFDASCFVFAVIILIKQWYK